MLNNNTRNKIMRKFDIVDKDMIYHNTDNVIADNDIAGEVIYDTENKYTQHSHLDNEYQDIVFHGTSNLQRMSGSATIIEGTIIIYSIKKVNNIPFLIYVLQRKTNSLQFCSTQEYTTNTFEELQSKLQNELSEELSFKGINNVKNELWFEIVDTDISIHLSKHSNKYVQCLVSEIVNTTYYLNIPISPTVTQHFLNHPECIYLYDNKNTPFDIPEVGYYGNYYKKIALIAAIGATRETPRASMGSYYYFAGYQRAVRYAIQTSSYKPMKINGKLITRDASGTYTKGGLVRFALFLGKTTSLLGRPSDSDDSANVSQELAKKEEFFKLTLKNRDTNGNWTNKYDSIFLGKTYITNCKTCPKENYVLDSQIIVKTFEQQIPLSYYYVDTSQTIDKDNLFSVEVE